MSAQIKIEGLEEMVEAIVVAKLAELSTPAPELDPWFDSKAAAEYLGVSRQRVHDATWAGHLPRHGEKGERLFFKRSELDQYMETKGR